MRTVIELIATGGERLEAVQAMSKHRCEITGVKLWAGFLVIDNDGGQGRS